MTDRHVRHGPTVVTFLATNGSHMAMLVAGPVVALVCAMTLIRHTNAMAYNDFLNVRSWPSVANEQVPGVFVLRSLLFATVLLVLFNTLAYLKDAWTHHAVSVLALYWCSVVVAVAWAAEIPFGWTRIVFERWDSEAAHLNEMAAGFLFGLFAVMDFVLYRHTRRPSPVQAPVSGEDERRRAEAEVYLLQLVAVDLPVVLGISSVIAVQHWLLERSPALGTGLASESFVTGFGSGSVVMHLAVSQAIFLFIYARHFRWLFSRERQPETDRSQSKAASPVKAP